MASRLSIFVSSPMLEFQSFRAAARDAILRLGHYPVMAEYWASSNDPAPEECLERLRGSLYIGILADRYGTCPHGSDKSMTELEHRSTKNTVTFS